MSGLVRDARDAPRAHATGEGVREVIGAADGCEPLSLSVLSLARRERLVRETAEEELLFVLAGSGELVTQDGVHSLERETGVRLAPGTVHTLAADDGSPLELVLVGVSEPRAPSGEEEDGTLCARLADQVERNATGERLYRVVFDADHGCPSATQFVGYIPVGHAPAHYHLYEEVIYVLEGEGVMHMNAARTPLRVGSCIHLPPRKLHTLENSGPGVMRVLGVFRPAGSPAAAFYPDGTPAYSADEG